MRACNYSLRIMLRRTRRFWAGGRPTGSDLMPVENKLNLLDRCTG
jgi:hypothetical protein